MGDRTAIGWVVNPDGSQGATWNILVGCSPVSPACVKCYAARLASTRLSAIPAYAGLARNGQWTGEVRLLEDRLAQPWHWRKPRGIFVEDMSDLFYHKVPDLFIARCFGIMLLCPHHTFYVLTKRAERLAKFTHEWDAERCVQAVIDHGPVLSDPVRARSEIERVRREGIWPPPNVIGGVSTENQLMLERRVPWLLQAKLAKRFLSCEPLLGPLDFSGPRRRWLGSDEAVSDPRVDWVIVGGENDLDARYFDLDAARGVLGQCLDAGTPVFLKQVGSRPIESSLSLGWKTYVVRTMAESPDPAAGRYCLSGLRHRAGADPSEWPVDLRIRQMHTRVAA